MDFHSNERFQALLNFPCAQLVSHSNHLAFLDTEIRAQVQGGKAFSWCQQNEKKTTRMRSVALGLSLSTHNKTMRFADMRKIFLGVALLLAALTVTTVAFAHGPRHGHGGPRRGSHGHGHSHSYVRSYHSHRPYYVVHGRPYGRGYYYPGRNHAHFEFRVWNAGYGRYHYYDPYLHCYYYYCPELDGYFPVP